MKEWINSGKPWIWGTAGGIALSLVLVFGVLWLTAARGLIYFWPSQVVETTFVEKDGSKIRLIGEIKEQEEVAVRRLVESHGPDRFVFGYGMDVRGAWRNLPAIYAMKEG